MRQQLMWMLLVAEVAAIDMMLVDKCIIIQLKMRLAAYAATHVGIYRKEITFRFPNMVFGETCLIWSILCISNFQMVDTVGNRARR